MRVTRATVPARQPRLSPACALALLQMLLQIKPTAKQTQGLKKCIFCTTSWQVLSFGLFLFQHLHQVSCRKTHFFKKVLKYCFCEGS